MARARNIKPSFFKNEDLVELPFEARLLFIGLWTLADREGRLEDRPKRIKMEVFPADDVDVDAKLTALAGTGFILRYEKGGDRFVQILNFTKHQMPHHKEVASVIPAPPGHAEITRHAYDVSPAQRERIFGRDGYCCLRCGDKDSTLSVDHIIALATGGDNSDDNLQTLCVKCNSSKGSATKDYRTGNVEPTLNQRNTNNNAPCPPDCLNPSLLNPESLVGRPKRRTQIPDDFYPDETGIAKANDSKVPVADELERFKDFHRGKGNTMVDWQAAWRTWVSNAVKFAKGKSNGFSSAKDESRKRVSRELTGYDPDAIQGVSSRVG